MSRAFNLRNKTTRSGDLRHKLGFFEKKPTDDGYGNVELKFSDTPDFTVFGKTQARFGGEAVLAERLQDHQTYTIVVRQSSLTDPVNASWMIKDINEGTIWAILSGPVDPDDSGAFYEFLCQTGVAP